jgi:hypothetical protein
VQKAAAAAADDDGGGDDDDDGDDLHDEDFDPNVSGGVPATGTVSCGSGAVTVPFAIHVPGWWYREASCPGGVPHQSRSCPRPMKSRLLVMDVRVRSLEFTRMPGKDCGVVQEDPAIREARLQYEPMSPTIPATFATHTHAHTRVHALPCSREGTSRCLRRSRWTTGGTPTKATTKTGKVTTTVTMSCGR